MSRELYGYVRGLKIEGETCSWSKPTLYSKYSDKYSETSVDVGNAYHTLFEYLEEKGRYINEYAEFSEHAKIQFRIISLNALCDRLNAEKKAFKKLRKKLSESELYDELYPQLKSLVTQIRVIADIGNIYDEDIYLKYYIC